MASFIDRGRVESPGDLEKLEGKGMDAPLQPGDALILAQGNSLWTSDHKKNKKINICCLKPSVGANMLEQQYETNTRLKWNEV